MQKVKPFEKPVLNEQQYIRTYRTIFSIIDRTYGEFIKDAGKSIVGKATSLRQAKSIFTKELNAKYPDMPVGMFAIRTDHKDKTNLCINFYATIMTDLAVTAYNNYGNNECKICGKKVCPIRDKHSGCCSKFIPLNFVTLVKNMNLKVVEK